MVIDVNIFKRIGLALTAMVGLSACGITIDGNQYKAQSPAFELEAFFDGKVTAWGIVQNRSGEIVQRFIVDIDGSMQDDVLVLDETFTYQLGEGPTKRIWRLTKNADGTYTGQAGDIAVPATGTSFGNAFNFVYEMDLEVDGTSYRVNFDDWFWAFDENTMMNRSYIKKFGIVMAEVTIFMQKQ
ncbi:lipoprotein [Glaciecola sp. KUL10]|nr:lipoprotein [Glaciecola sp. KUL10]